MFLVTKSAGFLKDAPTHWTEHISSHTKPNQILEVIVNQSQHHFKDQWLDFRFQSRKHNLSSWIPAINMVLNHRLMNGISL